MYTYHATIIKNLDADTSRAIVDVGFDMTIKLTLRWRGINAPELSTPEGRAAREALNAKLPPGTVCTITTQRDRKEKYGRYLATFDLEGENLNDWLVKSGHAVPYDSVKPRV